MPENINPTPPETPSPSPVQLTPPLGQKVVFDDRGYNERVAEMYRTGRLIPLNWGDEE